MEEVKLCLFTDYVILFRENPKDSIKKLLELIKAFGKPAGYKINIQKSVMILYTKNELSEKEIRKRIIIIGALKTIKYLGQFLNFSQLQFLHL